VSKAIRPRSQPKPPRPERPPRAPRPPRAVPLSVFLILLGLLVLPALAVHRLRDSTDLRVIAGFAVAVSLFTMFLYWRDKQNAKNDTWRTPEATLHFFEAIGGWPGAFFAQRVFRHKNAKRSYQIVFWFIVGMYQFTAFDSLQNFRYTRQLFALLSPEGVRPAEASAKRQSR